MPIIPNSLIFELIEKLITSLDCLKMEWGHAVYRTGYIPSDAGKPSSSLRGSPLARLALAVEYGYTRQYSNQGMIFFSQDIF